ncbi:hypothetical protein A2130_01250 [Candidatus Woesebacteria bacterium GWC2_33_12]|uniref:SSU ribosomal protein S6P modification protein n=1 Tax=Candidatus Woesebacteria bacterium GW2011_GWB1_33_22 TaxID=1618566 RepID=A0A0F9ZMK9_9BACT|nr:MAG: SSU ribosomal protein S6P modification protein [Candidatus Woesebacteria bacterium GW2011_GWC2_33_12]KKP42611.1 MAG: SSU ribosomal protein S6P modification protein [Candidatus Woesebacteria bacterium GW2011_GWA2_33_20]KKP45354.1 MAG: SSU ribosomal protein S6P modification protein [Candidatus Woesebacteria bacterium GW2011_GWB1_33_22]KKP47182.1 MAG: SSU ribosomal protein S6P modification protein [Microgenomates group bacterium GW2011_GWC1_33_28]KKP51024.1 MAG: SSU ribosomal protein S6P m
MVNILILTSGKVSKLDAFSNLVDKGSFDDIWYSTQNQNLKIKNQNLNNYKLIYFRMVGRSLEIATLVTNYATKNNIKIVDEIYTKSNLMPMSLGKSIELRKLIEAGIHIPRTVFGDLNKLPFPYVVKSTTGQKAKEVWLVKNKKELEILRSKINSHKLYFAQELIPNAYRIRILVIGDRVIGAIKRQTKWNKDETKETLNPIPQKMIDLALKSAKAVDLNICGVDILINSKTNETYVIEANAAPSWKLINKYCGVVVEDEIIKYLSSKI